MFKPLKRKGEVANSNKKIIEKHDKGYYGLKVSFLEIVLEIWDNW